MGLILNRISSLSLHTDRIEVAGENSTRLCFHRRLPSAVLYEYGECSVCSHCEIIDFIGTVAIVSQIQIDWKKLTQTKVTGWGNYLHTNTLVSQTCPTNKSCPSCEYCWSNKHCQLFETGYSHTNSK